jgi:hypothetical protein
LSEVAQIITAIMTGIVAIIAAYGALQTRKVHTIVNQQRTDMLNKIEELKLIIAQGSQTDD